MKARGATEVQDQGGSTWRRWEVTRAFSLKLEVLIDDMLVCHMVRLGPGAKRWHASPTLVPTLKMIKVILFPTQIAKLICKIFYHT